MDQRNQEFKTLSGMTPSAAQLQKLVSEYVTDAKEIVETCLVSSGTSQQFRDVYHNSLSAESVLAGLASPNLRPTLNSVRSIVLRVPMLVAVGHASVAKAELRRYLELILWTIYFTDHPIEWREFEGKTGAGFARDPHKPISHAAHRELGYYVDYARELMEAESSGLARQSLDQLKQSNFKLNAAVHPGQLARTNLGYHLKTGHTLSVQNRPTGLAEDVTVLPCGSVSLQGVVGVV